MVTLNRCNGLLGNGKTTPSGFLLSLADIKQLRRFWGFYSGKTFTDTPTTRSSFHSAGLNNGETLPGLLCPVKTFCDTSV